MIKEKMNAKALRMGDHSVGLFPMLNGIITRYPVADRTTAKTNHVMTVPVSVQPKPSPHCGWSTDICVISEAYTSDVHHCQDDNLAKG
jgi:hypothetical protein